MSSRVVEDATLSVELDPEGAPGVMTEVAAGVDVSIAYEWPPSDFSRGFEVTLRDVRAQIVSAFAVPERLMTSAVRGEVERAVQRSLRRYAEELMQESTRLTPATTGRLTRSFGGTVNAQAEERSPSGQEVLEGVLQMRDTIRAAERAPVHAYLSHPNCRCVSGFEAASRWVSEYLFAPSSEDRQAAEERAEALLARVLTEGERLALDRLGVVPVIGGETGELVLVSKKSQFNLLRYSAEELPRRRGFGWLPPKRRLMPRTWCLTSGGGWAPWQDRVASIVTALLRSERIVTDRAVRGGCRSLINSNAERAVFGTPEQELEPLLRWLAEDRCRNTDDVLRVAGALEGQGIKLA